MTRRPYRKKISGNCVLCGTFRLSLHRDHIIPKFQGGGDEPENIQLICCNCHEDKSREEQLGRKPTDEQRQKMSEAAKKRILDDKTKGKISAAIKGSTRSPETRERMRQAQAGHAVSQEQRLKISETLKRKWANGEITRSKKNGQ